MNLTVSSITIVDLTNKEAKKVAFSPNKNLITSSHNHLGKSVIMKSIYYTLGAEVYFPNPIKKINLLTYIDFSINDNLYRVARLKNTFLLYKSEAFIKSFSSVGEFEESLSELFHFEIDLVGKDQDGTIEKCPPVFYFMPYYIDQENGWSANSYSFNNIAQFDMPQRKNSFFFHLGVFDRMYVSASKSNKANDRRIKLLEKENEKLLTVIDALQSGMDSTQMSFDTESLEYAISHRQQEMQKILNDIEKVRREIVETEDQLIEISHDKDVLSKYIKAKKPQVEEVSSEKIECPRCGMIFEHSLTQKLEKAYLLESLHDDYTTLSDRQLKLERKLSKLKLKFSENQSSLSEYEKSMSSDKEIYNAYVKSKATNQILKEYHTQVGENSAEIDKLKKENSEMNKQLDGYRQDRNTTNDAYQAIVKNLFSKLDVPLDQVDDSIEPGSALSASGAYGPRCKIAQMLAFIEIQQSIANNIITFPLVIDSPNSLEQDKENLDSVIKTLLIWDKTDNQIIVASIEGADTASKIPGVKIITLTNPKNHLLSTQEYTDHEGEIAEIFTQF